MEARFAMKLAADDGHALVRRDLYSTRGKGYPLIFNRLNPHNRRLTALAMVHSLFQTEELTGPQNPVPRRSVFRREI